MTTLKTAKVLTFDRPMATTAPELPPQPPQNEPKPPPTSWQRHGTTAQIVSAICASFLLGIAALGVYQHFTADSKAESDKHINDLITAQLNPIANLAKDEHINGLIAAQLKPLNENVGKIAQEVSGLKGWLHIVNRRLDKSQGPEPALLAKSSDPEKALKGIKASLEQAEDRGKVLPELTLADYRRRVQNLPSSAQDYWSTVAAVVNYQSFVNQKEHNFPDPILVAKPCPFVTQSPNSKYNLIQGDYHFSDCVVDLDGTTNEVDGATFENSVIRWHGGQPTIKIATFINCRFLLDIKHEPARPDLVRRLLASDQLYLTLNANG